MPSLVRCVGDRRVREAGVRAAQLLGYVGVQLRQALDVGLVDDRLVVGDVEPAVALPVEERRDHDALHHVGGRVVVVARLGVAEVVAEERLVPVDVAAGGLGVGVEQQLVGVAALALREVPRSVHAVAVALAGLHRRQVAVPHVGVDLGQLDAGLGSLPSASKQAQLDLLGHLAEDREVGAAPVEGRAERVGASGPDLHTTLHLLVDWNDQSTPLGWSRYCWLRIPRAEIRRTSAGSVERHTGWWFRGSGARAPSHLNHRSDHWRLRTSTTDPTTAARTSTTDPARTVVEVRGPPGPSLETTTGEWSSVTPGCRRT